MTEDQSHPPNAPADGDATSDLDLAAALAAWPPLAPPAGFPERVLAARDADARRRRGRRAVLAGGAVAAVAAIALVLVNHRASSAGHGELTARVRITARLGDRGVAVAEPSAALTWQIDDADAATIDQRTGDVFYRVEHGGPFVVRTPAGEVHVTGTCFRVALVADAPAATAQVSVYEGRVVAEAGGARDELIAGARAVLSSAGIVPAAPGAAAPLSRDALVAELREREVELARLRAQLAAPAPAASTPSARAITAGPFWHAPSADQLAAWVDDCRVRFDTPAFDPFVPLAEPDPSRGVTADELDDYNAALAEVAARWRDLVRRLYVAATGDATGVETLSIQAMIHEIEDKGDPGEHARVLQRLARERAGVTNPSHASAASPLEQLLRAELQLGDQSEAAVARRLGAARARAIRGDAWTSRSELSGCPTPPR